jgi:hypothetical protein
MSINLSIKYKEDETNNQHIPISTNRNFEQYCIPICEQFSLAWIKSIIRAGLPLLKLTASFDEIINELKIFAAQLSGADREIPQDYRDRMIRNVETILHVMADIRDQPQIFKSVYLG